MPRFLIPGDKVDPERKPFVLLPDGDYNAQVDTSLAQEAKPGSTAHYVVMQYVVYYRENPIDEPREVKVRDNVFVEGDGVFRAVQLAIACGDRVPKGQDFAFEPARYHGKRIRINVGHREYNGKTYNQVNAYLPMESNEARAARTDNF